MQPSSNCDVSANESSSIERSSGGTAIANALVLWHRHMSGEAGILRQVLADDVVFYSPVVFTPQRGRDITEKYLLAAAVTFAGPLDDSPADNDSQATERSRFRYTKEVVAGDTAVLEFETTMDGKYVNGVDIIRVDGEGRIIEFRVMVRPLQALNAVHALMGRELAGEKTS